MNPEVKELWIAALKSGDYKQGHLALQSDGAYCCLGVLCDLASKVIDLEVEMRDSGNTAYDDETGYLPLSVQEWAGVKSKAGNLRVHIPSGGMGYWSLSQLNDSGYSFEQIAEVIREQF